MIESTYARNEAVTVHVKGNDFKWGVHAIVSASQAAAMRADGITVEYPQSVTNPKD